MATSTADALTSTTFFDPQASINEQSQLAHKIIVEQEDGTGIDPKDALRLAELFNEFVTWRNGDGFDPNWKEAFARAAGRQSIQFGRLDEFAACKPGSRIAGQPLT